MARIDNRYFTTLQGAANVAQDGETIVVLKDIEKKSGHPNQKGMKAISEQVLKAIK